MQLDKNQIEAVRYQFKKRDLQVSNDQIRQSAQTFSNFDAEAIYEDIINQRQNPSDNALTINQKQSLVKIQATQMGITLSDAECLTIADMGKDEISDAAEYLRFVGSAIRQFINDRNTKARESLNNLADDIGRVLNAGNEELSDIFSDVDDRILGIVADAKKQRKDYKSPYTSRLESIR